MKLCFYGAGQKERISILCILNLFKNYIYIYTKIYYIILLMYTHVHHDSQVLDSCGVR